MAKSGHGHFFAVGRDTFIKACDLGLNPAVAFLTMACGTGGDHQTTKWSATAVEKYAGLGWRRADETIDKLRRAQLLKRTDDKSDKRKPAYSLKAKGDLIWLPNSIITGVGDEVPPVRKLRQAQSVMTLRLFVELYREQNLRDDGGISRNVTFRRWERTEFGGRGAYTVWAFDDSDKYSVCWNETTLPHQRKQLTPEEQAEGLNAGVDFFARFNQLHRLGLVEWVPYLMEGDDGEPLHALDDGHLLDAMHDAAESLITDGMQPAADTHDYLVPVPNHIEQAQLYSVARLHYRPHTRATSAWWARDRQAVQDYIRMYREIAGSDRMAAVG